MVLMSLAKFKKNKADNLIFLNILIILQRKFIKKLNKFKYLFNLCYTKFVIQTK